MAKSGAGKRNFLIIGSGGREHALGWKLAQSKNVGKIFFAPGNGGTFQNNVEIKADEIEKLISFAKQHKVMTIVGPEDPLSKGIVDAFEKEGLDIFGPTREAAMLETSKTFSKQFMHENGILTAKFKIFSDPEKAKDYAVRQKADLVVKADGLAAGKGVFVCDGADEAINAIDIIMVKKEFGDAGGQVVIEEKLTGQEASFIAICDGKSIYPLASAQDHKRIFDNDKGPNTGGMGTYSPAPLIDKELHKRIMEKIMEPVVSGMGKRKKPFKGFLYAGVMVDEKTKEPYVLEFNARMGDPECQPIMMRMKSDLFPYVEAAVDERIEELPPLEWKDLSAVCVVMAEKGYPGKYDKGHVIEGLDSAVGPAVMVFHAGTARDSQNRVVTNGGRVLGVTALGKDILSAIDNAYSAVRKIHWGKNDHYYRTDIGRKAL